MRPNFKAFMLVPKRGKAEALRKLLGGLCVHRAARHQSQVAFPSSLVMARLLMARPPVPTPTSIWLQVRWQREHAGGGRGRGRWRRARCGGRVLPVCQRQRGDGAGARIRALARWVRHGRGAWTPSRARMMASFARCLRRRRRLGAWAGRGDGDSYRARHPPYTTGYFVRERVGRRGGRVRMCTRQSVGHRPSAEGVESDWEIYYSVLKSRRLSAHNSSRPSCCEPRATWVAPTRPRSRRIS